MEEKVWRRFDFSIFLIMLALAAFGIVIIYSTTMANYPTLDFHAPAVEQTVYLLAGMVLFFVAAAVDYRVFGQFHWVLYGANLALLAIVRFVGHTVNGSQRWISLGPFHLQPSELAKLLIIITLAKILSDHEKDSRSLKTLGLCIVLVTPVLGLVFLQPDLGTAIIIGCIWAGMLLMGGIRPLYFFAMSLLGGTGIFFGGMRFLKGYQRDRLLIFMDPQKDPLGAGYQIIQAQISVGSGGLTGRGLGQGPETQLNYLPVSYTDFIFSGMAEQIGFVGELGLFAGYLFLLWRLTSLATRAQDTFGRLLVSGVAIMLLAQTFVNVGMNIRLMPVTGVPLPFVTYGGSSLLTIVIALGIVQSVVMHKREGIFRMNNQSEIKWPGATTRTHEVPF